MSVPLFEFTVKQAVNGFQVVTEHRFHPKRRWRFDLAIPEKKIAIEIEGGSWTNGRHTRGKGFQNDMAKYNAAQILGWKVLRYTPQQIAECVDDLLYLVRPELSEREA